jgi:hypothetical protein
MKNPYVLGREAQDRDIPDNLNPYWNAWERKQRYSWSSGWFDRDMKIWRQFGLKFDEYEKIRQKIVK